MNELALFAGAGGGILGGMLLGWRTVAAVEIEEYPRAILLQRQADGILPRFPVWDDIRTFDGTEWRGRVDVVTGGFPCQDISAAGRGAGIDGERSGLWSEMARVIGEVRPRFAFVENSPVLTSRGLGRVLGDLAEMGYDAEWCVLGADDCGAPHRRKRIWILAYAERDCRGAGFCKNQSVGNGDQLADCGCNVADSARIQQRRQKQRPQRERVGAGSQQINDPDAQSQRLQGGESGQNTGNSGIQSESMRVRGEQTRCPEWWIAEPNVGRVAHGVASRVDRLKAIGNGQVPAVAATAWSILIERFV